MSIENSKKKRSSLGPTVDLSSNKRPFLGPTDDSSSNKQSFSELDIAAIICEKCRVTFGEKKNLYAHIRKFHPNDEITLEGNQVCGMCDRRFRLISQLHEHLQDHHNISLNFVNETFYCENDFIQWKKKTEKENQSFFKFRNASENNGEGIKLKYYVCHRSGFSKPKQNRMRHMKASGSVKSGCTCPAIIISSTQIVNGICEINVKYQSVHVGHDIEVGKIRLTIEERTSLASSLQLGVPMSKILDQTRENYSPTKRYGLTTRKDLHNIRRDFKIENKVILQPDDATSVDVLVKKKQSDCMETNPVIIYKHVGDMLLVLPAVGSNDFLFGIMSEAQAKLLELSDNTCVMIDSTHGDLNEENLVVDINVSKERQDLEEDAIIDRLHKISSTNIESRKNKLLKKLQQLQQRIQECDSVEVLQYIEEKINAGNSYFDVSAASSSRPNFKSKIPEIVNSPPNKNIDRQKIHHKEKRLQKRRLNC